MNGWTKRGVDSFDLPSRSEDGLRTAHAWADADVNQKSLQSGAAACAPRDLPLRFALNVRRKSRQLRRVHSESAADVAVHILERLRARRVIPHPVDDEVER